MPPLQPRKRKSGGRIDYRTLSLVDLVRRIVNKADRKAVDEFHAHRGVFRFADQPLLFTNFLVKLREYAVRGKWAGEDVVAPDNAYDLTLEKFRNLPAKQHKRMKRKQTGPDCRHYFRAFLKCATKAAASQSGVTAGERESAAAQILQGLVRYHFKLSCLESSRRSRHLDRRYTWMTGGRTITVWMPADMTGKQCRTWLEENVTDLNPSRECDRERVQEIVSNRLIVGKVISLTTPDGSDRDIPDTRPSLPLSVRNGSGVSRLADLVAEEKTQHPELLGPTIHKMGKEKLASMIHRIFDDVIHGDYSDAEVRKAFGLRKSTYSRFAGSQWFNRFLRSRKVRIPDLWANVAQMLYTHPGFADAVEAMGIREAIQEILRARRPHGRRRGSHE